MRIMIKGGVWKNTEDEILKAAVMKYGKNQWARISSLLVRKSAKQCKARWYEWLDPSIKKTEWTREEDEKLLHLAKLMPTQWRTIAPIVGRTPSQCLERYEKLLDAACVKDENYEPSDDPRKLRPGEIDPNPESKPARPDPVDMDEDEKEMLSEARARLANTRGKKAKRKAREKQLEEARRLASLQKRRELKAAGIDNRQRRRKRKGIDYNAEIPFEKKPPPGFFDVADEERLVEQPKFPTTIEELEGKRRVDIEAQKRKQDIARNKIAQRQDTPSAILQANKLNDPETVRKRSKLMLPPPQISDHELEEIAKMGYASDLVLANEELGEGSSATRALLANYSQTPQHGMTPLRTPQRTPGGKVDAIMMEAENLARLRESQTPLLGGENPELHPSDFSGVTPKKREFLTPNPMATPLSTPGGMGVTPRIGMTPSRDGYSFGATPKGTPTPLRDELHINEDMDMLDSDKLEQRRQAELKRNLRSGLLNLPQPKNEYQIVMPPVPDENEEPEEEKMEEDMSDRLAREKAREEARLEELLRKRSKVLQRELPRPPAASLDLIKKSLKRGDDDKSSFVPITLFEQADEMIRRELLTLLGHDNAKYPLDGKPDKEKKSGTKGAPNGKSAVSIPEIEDFEEYELKVANSLIEEEASFLRVALGHEDASFDDFVEARDACQDDLMYFPGRNSYGLASIASNSEKLEALQNEFENVKNRMEAETRKAVKLEQKIKVLTHGHQMRSTKLWSQLEATFKQIDTAGTEFECFQSLQKQEQLAASYRINGLLEEVNKQKELEQILQRRYGSLIAEQDRVHRLLEEYKLQARIQEEIEAKNRALEAQIQEEIEAKNRALEAQIQEEIEAKNRALEAQIQEEIEAKNRALEAQIQEEIEAKNRALEAQIQEEIEAKNRALEAQIQEEIEAKNRAPESQMQEEIEGKNWALEAQVQEEIEGKSHALEAQIQEEIEAKNRALEVSDSAKDPEADTIISENISSAASSDEKYDSVMVDDSHDENPFGQKMDLTLDETPQTAYVNQKDLEVEQEKLVTSMVLSEEVEKTPTNFDSYIKPEIPHEEQFLVTGGENPITVSVEEGGLPFQSSGIVDDGFIQAKTDNDEEMVDSGEQIQVVADSGSCDKAIEQEFPALEKDENPVRCENPVDILIGQTDFSFGSNGGTGDELIVPSLTSRDHSDDHGVGTVVDDKTIPENGISHAGLKFPADDQCLITQSENPINIPVMETGLAHGIDEINILHTTSEQEKMMVDPVEKIDTGSGREMPCIESKRGDSTNETTDS